MRGSGRGLRGYLLRMSRECVLRVCMTKYERGVLTVLVIAF